MKKENYAQKLIRANSGASSKRFIAIWSMILLTAVIICSLFGIEIMDDIIYSLVSLILGSSGLTLINKNVNRYKNTSPESNNTPQPNTSYTEVNEAIGSSETMPEDI